jgi:hypothetical protein
MLFYCQINDISCFKTYFEDISHRRFSYLDILSSSQDSVKNQVIPRSSLIRVLETYVSE